MIGNSYEAQLLNMVGGAQHAEHHSTQKIFQTTNK